MFSQNLENKEKSISLSSKIEGMLIGSAIGDAAGGPVEFVSPPEQSFWCTTNKKITKKRHSGIRSAFQTSPLS